MRRTKIIDIVIGPKSGERCGPEMISYYKKYFTIQLDKYSDGELIDAFNGTVGIRAYGIPRAGYLWAMQSQLKKRKIDYSVVDNETGFSYAKKVKLIDNKLELL